MSLFLFCSSFSFSSMVLITIVENFIVLYYNKKTYLIKFNINLSISNAITFVLGNFNIALE